MLFSFLIVFYARAQELCSRRLLDANDPDSMNPLYYNGLQFQPTYNQENNKSIIGADQNITIFTLEAFSITDFYIDLRHLYNYTTDNISTFNYTSDWQISIYYNNDSSILLDEEVQFKDSVALPDEFLQNSTSKYDDYSFSLFALQKLRILVKIEIINKNFQSNKYLFINLTKIDNHVPNRAIYGERMIFVFVQSDQGLALPYNLMSTEPSSYIISYTKQLTKLQPLNLTKSKEISASVYWNVKRQVLQPYVPYFSNCNGYGQYLYFYQIAEHENCQLVPRDQTKPIRPFVFGDKPYGDSCSGIKFECVLDDSFSAKQSNPRWFELGADEGVFAISSNPISADQFNEKNFQIDQINQVTIQTKNALPQGKMASDIILTINYYQVTQSVKRIISGSLEFQNFYIINEQNQNDPIYYNLIFNYIPLDQGALVKAFALEWPVYFIIFLGIGFLSVLEITVFLFYHYIFNRY